MTFHRLLVHALICLASLCIPVNEVCADMYLDRSIVTFGKGSLLKEDVKVSNSADENIYVQVEVLEVQNPGNADELRTRVTDPSAMKLIATPNKLIIPPNGQKYVRIVNLQPANDEERIYRVNFKPIVAPLAEQTSQLRIVVAYQILTIVQPDRPDSLLRANRTGKSIDFENLGNTNVLISDVIQCHPTNNEQC
jgi:P pilus assembly chaperone PapD